MSVQPGAVLNGRYTLREHIATGGMGEVWRAHDDVLGREVAVKMLKSEFADHDGFLRRFRDEARHAASLSHPGIAAVHDYGEHDGTPYLVMELVRGETLSDLIARIGPVPLDRALSILADTAEALAAAHARGVVHRDVKPGNLLLTDEGRVKVTDFGIARAIGAAPVTVTGEVVGTAQYISPEQASGEQATPASDIYALGVVAFEVLTGQRPFTADSPVALAMAHVRQPPPPLPPTLPADVAAVVHQALAKAPEDRPIDAATLATLFRDAAARRAAPTLPQPSAPLRRTRSAPRWIGLVVAAVAAATTLAAFALSGGGDGTATDPSGTTPPPPESGVAETTVAAPPTAAATTTTTMPAATTVATTPPAVVVDAASFVGRKRGDARAELEAMGLSVDERHVAADDARNDTVVDVTPTGELRPGDSVTIVVARKGRGNGDD